MKKSISRENVFTTAGLIGVFLVAGAFWLYAMVDGAFHYEHDKNDEMSRFGQLGDSFGWLNCLFSGFAMTGAIATLFLQMQWQKRAERKERLADQVARRRHSEQLEHSHCQHQLHKLEDIMMIVNECRNFNLEFIRELWNEYRPIKHNKEEAKFLGENAARIVAFVWISRNRLERAVAITMINFKDLVSAAEKARDGVGNVYEDYKKHEERSLSALAVALGSGLNAAEMLEKACRNKAAAIHKLIAKNATEVREVESDSPSSE